MSLKSVDELDPPSREFYERAKFKLTLSLFIAALGTMFLGLASQAGGRSRSNAYLADVSGLTGQHMPSNFIETYLDR
jgi:hypothetical protein